jgi:hypothetical protein
MGTTLAVLALVYPTRGAAPPAEPFDTSAAVLRQTAAIVEGDVSDISFSFDQAAGPRTIVRLSNVKSLWGTFSDSEVRLSVLGGPLPDGRYLDIAELPNFISGGHYVVFLSNRNWFHSPVIGEWALRTETIKGKGLLLSDSGNVIFGLSQRGLVASSFHAFKPRPDAASLHDPPVAIPDLAQQDVSGAPTKDEFVNAVTSMAASLGIKPEGSFIPAPDPTRSWNTIFTVAPGGTKQPQSPDFRRNRLRAPSASTLSSR